ncbi:hypothetical protein J5D20_01705 [Helicobacter pylori]|uniref:hypothetical protein n=1 Tax=Helicobacter pylori TaxID=210 RepID=UPI001AE69D8E|nr:hypothetical protein [Helicobacter pylori]QTO98708.1 hypothetical protein J5D20_01705 [Helicobacter pylori]
MIIKKLDFNGAIKTLRELETIGTLPNHYRDGINYSVSNLNGNILLQTSLKRKSHNELNNKKEKINMQTHACMEIFTSQRDKRNFYRFTN